jgi:nucleoside phosphorylase
MGSGGERGSTLATPEALRTWQPKAIIMPGIAFGKDPGKQKMADVLVASQIIPYEKQRRGQETIFRDPIPPSNALLQNRFENALDWHFNRPDGQPCKLRIGSILSGDKLVDDPEFKAELFTHFPEAIGGEMEGAGLAAAAGRMGVPWILVKAICDWGDGKKHGKHQPLAAAAAVSLVHHVLSPKSVLPDN